MILFIDKKMAQEGGMTHTGRVYGMPCWLADVDDPEMITAVTKFYPLNFYLAAMDWMYERAAEAMSMIYNTDVEMVTPISVDGEI